MSLPPLQLHMSLPPIAATHATLLHTSPLHGLYYPSHSYIYCIATHHMPHSCMATSLPLLQLHMSPPLSHLQYMGHVAAHPAAAWATSPLLQPYRPCPCPSCSCMTMSLPPLQLHMSPHPITATHAPLSCTLLLHGPCHPPHSCTASPCTSQLHGPCWHLPLSHTGYVATYLAAACTTLLPLAVLAPGPTSYVCSCRTFVPILNSRKYIY